jgi:hypothetical protein
MQTSTTPAENRTGLGARVDRELKKQVAHKLLDAGMSMSAWLEQVMREFVGHGAQKNRIHRVRDDWQDK